MNIQWKKAIKTILIILCMIVLLSAVGCNRQEDAGQASGISFREASVTVERYETCTLELQGAEGKQIEWKTGDESVATVQDGVICGWKKGNTQILACVDGEETACNIIVTDNQYVPVIQLRETDELALDLGGTYTLKPTLHYNAREYSDVEYTYSCVGDAVTVDENGVIQAAKTGEAVVCVQGKWRTNVVQSSLTVYVIDVSTSVEVSDKVFDIYLNSQDKEFPSSADLGISVFDNDAPIEEKDASIKYIELLMEGDVEGAATVKDGVVYAKKIGTTHFVAEYTPATGDAVRTTVFTVNVHKSPAEIYMSPIAGEEYESFITPMSPDNSVKWDENMGAFHLINMNAAEDDGRAFLFSREYIDKILRYTNAKSIVFEVKSDGISNGSLAPDEVIYQGFYPEWYDPDNYLRIDKCGEWTKVEIFFDKIPLDSDGNRKSIMLLSSKEGMYIRNIRPMTEGSFLTMDVEITTLGGNWSKDIEIGAYPHSYQGSITDYTNRVAVKAGVKTTIKYRLDDFLEGGRVPGFGLVIFGGPEWDAKLPDGYTPDRHTLKISNLRVSGETNYSLDLSTAAWASGKTGTGFTDANGSGIPSYEDGAIIITNGFCYDGHKFTLNSEEAKNRTYLYLDMQIDTLGGDWLGDIEMRFYPHNFEGNPHEVFADKVAVKAGKQVSVRLDAKKYLIDGELPGIGLGIFGGPTWDATLPDGYTPDRHTVTITGIRLEGALNMTVELSYSECVSGTEDTGYTAANGSGQASIVDGTIVISNGFCYDCHKITFGSAESQNGTYVCLDMQIDTLGGDWTNDIEMRFYDYNFQGNPHEDYSDRVVFKAGERITVRLKADDYLVDGKLEGIGIGMFLPGFDARAAENRYLLAHNEISWMAINRVGTVLSVEVRPAHTVSHDGETALLAEDGYLRGSHLVADADGRILSFSVRGGQMTVVPEQMVLRGQLLASGIYTSETGDAVAGRAHGEVLAETVRVLRADIPITETVIRPDGSVRTEGTFVLFGHDILTVSWPPRLPEQIVTFLETFQKNGEKSGIDRHGCGIITDEAISDAAELPLCLPGGLPLPVSVRVQNRLGIQTTERALTEEEALLRARTALDRQEAALGAKQIISREETVLKQDGVLTAERYVFCVDNIAVPEEYRIKPE